MKINVSDSLKYSLNHKHGKLLYLNYKYSADPRQTQATTFDWCKFECYAFASCKASATLLSKQGWLTIAFFFYFSVIHIVLTKLNKLFFPQFHSKNCDQLCLEFLFVHQQSLTVIHAFCLKGMIWKSSSTVHTKHHVYIIIFKERENQLT